MSQKYTINTKLAASASAWTSAIIVNAADRLNISFRVGGSMVQAPTISAFSGELKLQRKLINAGDDVWRDVESWTIAGADAMGASFENISVTPEPEDAYYRLGIDFASAEYSDGSGFARLGTN